MIKDKIIYGDWMKKFPVSVKCPSCKKISDVNSKQYDEVRINPMIIKYGIVDVTCSECYIKSRMMISEIKDNRENSEW